MFITVNFGDNKQEIFNPNCPIHILLHAIKTRCKCDYNDTVDLSDEDGSVKNVHRNLTDYGTRYFEDRENLILLRVEKDFPYDTDDPDHVTYIPLATNKQEDPDFIAKLNPRPSHNFTSRGNGSNSSRTQSQLKRSTSDGSDDKGPKTSGGRRGSVTGRRPSLTTQRRGRRGSIASK